MGVSPIQKPISSQNKKSIRPVFVLLAVLIALALGAGVWMWLSKDSPMPIKLNTEKLASDGMLIEITNFTGKPEYYFDEKRVWGPVVRNGFLKPGDKIKTAAGEEIDLRISGLANFRLMPNSVLVCKQSGWAILGPRKAQYQLRLVQGALLGVAEKGFDEKAEVEIATSEAKARIRQGLFEIRAKSPLSWFGVLKGTMEIAAKDSGASKSVSLRPLQKLEVSAGQKNPEIKRVGDAEWDHLKTAYELIQRSALQETAQIDLAKKAGNLFDKAYDHGNFYTPKMGFAMREFAEDSAGAVSLVLDYDVFPTGSYVGMYIKFRGLDLAEAGGIGFDARLGADTDQLQEMQIEIKSKSGIIRRLAVRNFGKDWKTLTLPLAFSKSTPITEMTFLFSNGKVGPNKKGTIELRHLNFLPRAQASGQEPGSAGSAVVSGDVAKPDVAVARPKDGPASAAGA